MGLALLIGADFLHNIVRLVTIHARKAQEILDLFGYLAHNFTRDTQHVTIPRENVRSAVFFEIIQQSHVQRLKVDGPFQVVREIVIEGPIDGLLQTVEVCLVSFHPSIGKL